MITLPLAKIVGKLEAHLADRDAGNTGKKNKRKKHKAPLPEDPELQGNLAVEKRISYAENLLASEGAAGHKPSHKSIFDGCGRSLMPHPVSSPEIGGTTALATENGKVD